MVFHPCSTIFYSASFFLVTLFSETQFHSKAFWKKSSSAHKGCIYFMQKCFKNSKFVKYYCSFFLNVYFLNEMYFCDQSWIFSIITPVSVSHDPSEIILICWFAQETFLSMNVENGCCLWKLWYNFVFQDSLINRKFKKQHLFEIKTFSNIMYYKCFYCCFWAI